LDRYRRTSSPYIAPKVVLSPLRCRSPPIAQPLLRPDCAVARPLPHPLPRRHRMRILLLSAALATGCSSGCTSAAAAAATGSRVTPPPPFNPRCSGTLGRWRRATVLHLLSRLPLRICRISSLAFASGGIPASFVLFAPCPCCPLLFQHGQRGGEPAHADKNAHGKLLGISVHGHHSGARHPLAHPAAAARA
jgi:hypothetical protein